MRAVPYSQVLGLASQLCFGVATPNSTDAATLNAFIQENTTAFWRSFWWPELMIVEQRAFRDNYTGNHAAGTEVYYPPTQAYYLATKGPTTVAPATLAAGVWSTNYSEWIEVQETLAADDWVTAKAYVAGDRVRNPSDDKAYACHTAHTAGGSFDGTKFGALKRWRRSLEYVQTGKPTIDGIEGIYEDDPDLNLDAPEIPFTLGADILVEGDEPKVWIKFRKSVPSWSGTIHDSSLVYLVGEQVYFGSDYYRVKVASTGNLPTNTTDWEKIEFPYVFRSSVARGAFADWLDAEGQQDKSGRNKARAVALNDAEIEEIQARQKQTRALPVRVYR